MSVLKYASKLRKMSSAEISFRVRQQARNRAETLKWKKNGNNHDVFVPRHIRSWDLRQHPFPAPGVRFFGLAEDAEDLRSEFSRLFPGKLASLQSQADQLLAHRFRFLGLEVELPDPIPWNRNPQTGAEYPRQHHALLDTFNTEKYGDVKYAWELNRQQFFIEIAKAYFLTGEEKYAAKIWEWLESWIRDNPHKIGINHTSVLEHAVRIFSWLWAYFFTRESAVWTPERLEVLARNLLLQGEMIEENLSYYYSPYNHLIGELAALAFLGTVYGNSPKTQTWRDRYWQELEAQAEKQFHPDGFTVEQAGYYHHFTLGFYLMAALLREHNGLPVSARLWEILERAIELPMHLTRPDGQLPMLGDIDSARSLYFYDPAPKWDLRPFLALGAAIFRRGDLKFVAGSAGEEILWLAGSAGVQAFERLKAEKPAQFSREFPGSGYAVLRDGWESGSNYCCFDCGEIAHGVFRDETPSAAHGHADILSFELCIEGRPLVIDPGFYTYFGPLEWHRYFRSTRGHNAIEVNGAGQAQHQGRLGWSNVSLPKTEIFKTSPEWEFAGGAIDRFAGLGEKVFHRRYILFRKGKYFLVMDEVAGEGGKPFRVESSLHFSPGNLMFRSDRLVRNGQEAALLALPDAAKVSIAAGGTAPDQGWMAQGYGERAPAPVVRITLQKPLPVRLGMLFPLPALRNRVSRLHLEHGGENITVYRVAAEEGEERVHLNPRRKKFWIGSEETDAVCVIETSGPGKEKRMIVIR